MRKRGRFKKHERTPKSKTSKLSSALLFKVPF